jgi:hypothetical protein
MNWVDLVDLVDYFVDVFSINVQVSFNDWKKKKKIRSIHACPNLSQGNIILTSADYIIITLLHTHKHEGDVK